MSDNVVYSVGPDEKVKPLHCDNCDANVMTRIYSNRTEPDNALWIKLSGGYGQFIDELPDEMEFAPTRIGEEITYCSVCNMLYGEGHSPMCCNGGEWVTEPPLRYIPMREEWTEEEIERFDRETAKLNRLVLCHECAHSLCEAFPAFDKVINPHHSHSHTTKYRESNPDHWGYDYDHYKEV